MENGVVFFRVQRSQSRTRAHPHHYFWQRQGLSVAEPVSGSENARTWLCMWYASVTSNPSRRLFLWTLILSDCCCLAFMNNSHLSLRLWSRSVACASYRGRLIELLLMQSCSTSSVIIQSIPPVQFVPSFPAAETRGPASPPVQREPVPSSGGDQPNSEAWSRHTEAAEAVLQITSEFED